MATRSPQDPARERPASERPLVVVSNRLPFTIQRSGGGLELKPSAGGLVSAFEPVLRQRGGTWIGWAGLELHEGESIPERDRPYDVFALPLGEGDVARYLNGFSNRTLWPLFHSLPLLTRFVRADWERYEAVNRRFAEAVVERAHEDDLIWVNDYQLTLVPSQIRESMPEARLGFFLHIPFPPYDIFRLLPWDREILRGLLACDLIGFHTLGYAQNFFDCAENRLGARVDRSAMVVQHGNRAVRVGVFPIGIDFDDYEGRAKRARKRETQREKIVLGVDRLDYTKGIPDRIRAFARLLERHPEHREKVVLLQIAVPSRSQVVEYRDLKRELDELVGQVNGRFATASWSPIRYLYRSVSQDRLAAIYRDADVALVTPLRDGMNLVAKEYVASQVEDPGVLILSRLAGAGETMREALLVNPYDVEETTEALHRALCMEEGERRSRMVALRKRERRDDVHAWVSRFLASAESSRAALTPLTSHDFNQWLEPFFTRPKLALFLDYDGTLAQICPHPSEAHLEEGMAAALDLCASRSDTDVAIVSGRALEDVRAMVGHPGLTYAGNHGLEISSEAIPDFVHEDLVHYQKRTVELVNALQEVAIEGAWTEAKGPTVTYHYRGVAPASRRGLVDQARQLITTAGFQARQAHLAIEARPPIGWDKGRAVLHILKAHYGPAWSDSVRVIYVGDDETDEDAFRFLAGLAITFRVGAADGLTAATRRLPDVEAVQALLEWIGGHGPIASGQG